MHVLVSNYIAMFNCIGNQDLLSGLEYQLGQLQLHAAQPQLEGVLIQVPAFPMQLPLMLQLSNLQI